MNSEILQRLEHESALDYIYRVCSYKEDLGLSWPALAEEINNELSFNYSDSWYRKNYTNHSFPASLVKVAEETCAEESINDMLLELKKERIKNADERSQAMAAIRKLSREETLLEIAKSVAKELKTKRILPNYEYIFNSGDRTAILQISDWHYGIQVNNPWNLYNPEVARDRLIQLRSKVWDVLEFNKVKTLYIINLGDLISGRIHETIRIQNRIDVITQTLEVAEMLTEFIASLSQKFDIKYISCSDNHSRLEPKKELSLDLESLTRVIDPLLKLRIENAQLKGECGNVEFIDSPYGHDIAKFKIFNHEIAAVHGHKDNPKHVVHNMTMVTQCNYALVLTAHLHHFNCDELNNTLVVSNGSMMGVDDYAETLRLTNKPSQNVIIVSEDNPAESIHRIILS